MAAEGKGWRPFATVEEHDEHLIDQWNRIVGPGDQVWHLGDVGMGPEIDILAKVSRLRGEKHLITGNHDPVWPGHRDSYKKQRRWLETFASVQPFARRRVGKGRSYLLSHFPYQGDHQDEDRYSEYRLPDTGLWVIHGHVHNEWAERGRQINVGVDARDWRPVNMAELINLMGDK
jgi:calcineurin-like phosphoesterase family protein